MSFDHDPNDALRSAADDLRARTGELPVPAFTPRSSGAGPFAAGVAAAVLAIAGFVGIQRLTGDGSSEIDVAAPTTTQAPATTATEPSTSPANELDLPPLAGTNAQPTSDSQSGLGIVRLTDAPQLGAIAPAFSSSATFNPSGSLFVLYQQGDGHLLFDGNTLEPLGPISISSDDVYNWSWHPTDPDVLFFPDGGSSNRLRELNVRTGGSKVAATFDQCLSVGQGQGFGSTANNTAHMGLLCDTADGEFWMSYNLVDRTTTVASEPTDSGSAPFAAAVDGSLFAVFTGDSIRLLDASLAPTATDPIPAEVSAFAVIQQESTGQPVAITTLYDESDGLNGLAISVNLVTGERFGLIDDRDGFPPSGAQIAGTLNAGRVAIATANTSDNSESVAGAYVGQITLLTPGAEPDEQILAAHRMSEGSYQGTEWGDDSILALDPLGRYVLFSSDWGTRAATNTYAILIDR